MNNLASTILSVMATFIVTLGLNTGVNYLTSDRGSVSISEPLLIAGQPYQIVTIENYTKEVIDGLLIQVPFSAKDVQLSSSLSTKFSATTEDLKAGTKTIKVEQILPRITTRLVVPISIEAGAKAVKILNAESVSLRNKPDEGLESPLRTALVNGAITAGIYAAVMGIFTYVTHLQIKHLEGRMKESNKRVKELNSNAEELRSQTREEIDEIRSTADKMKILLLARINDFSQELTFWRNAIKELLIRSNGTPQQADELIDKVIKSLKTYGTREKGKFDFDAIKVASNLLHQQRGMEPNSKRAKKKKSEDADE